MGSRTTGTLRGLRFSGAEATQSALGGRLSHVLGRFQPAKAAGDRKPVIALLGAIVRLRNGHRREGTVRTLVFADESMRVCQNLVSGRGFERTAFGILDARIVIECSLLGASGVADAFFSGKRVNIRRVQIEVAGNRSQLRGFRYSAEWIFGSDLGQLQRRFQHAVQACPGKVAGVGAGSALAVENTQADCLRAGLFQSLDLP